MTLPFLTPEQVVEVEAAIRDHCKFNFMGSKVQYAPCVRVINNAVLIFFPQNELGYNTLDAPQVTLYKHTRRIGIGTYNLQVEPMHRFDAFRNRLKQIVSSFRE
jgi:hypothetical protein